MILFNLNSEINVVYPTFAKELGLPIRLTEVGEQKFDGSTPDIYGMVVIAFSVKNKVNQVKFFEMTFLVANVSLKVVFRILFLTLKKVDVDFLG